MTYNEINEEIKDLLKYAVLELRQEHQTHDEEGCLTDEFYDEISERIWENLDCHEWVIFTHLAKEVADAVGKYDAFDTWDEVTGERFDNWMQVSFANLYHVFININLENTIQQILNDNKNY